MRSHQTNAFESCSRNLLLSQQENPNPDQCKALIIPNLYMSAMRKTKMFCTANATATRVSYAFWVRSLGSISIYFLSNLFKLFETFFAVTHTCTFHVLPKKNSAACSPYTHRNRKGKTMPNTPHTRPTVFTVELVFLCVYKCNSSIEWNLLLFWIVVIKRTQRMVIWTVVNFFTESDFSVLILWSHKKGQFVS